jgi:hypothetical protein
MRETVLHYEEIARHHVPLTVDLPLLNDNGETETLSAENYELQQEDGAETEAIDKDYRWKHLAQDSGVFSREIAFPRSLLWRKVSGATLTIHVLDTIRPKEFLRNRPFTAIHLRFPVRILPNCIGLSEWGSTTVVYVLTVDCVLYTIPLSDQLLLGQSRRAELITDVIDVHRPLFLQARFGQGKVSLDVPHFMYVIPHSDKIIFAMQDGTLHQYAPSGNSSLDKGQ